MEEVESTCEIIDDVQFESAQKKQSRKTKLPNYKDIPRNLYSKGIQHLRVENDAEYTCVCSPEDGCGDKCENRAIFIECNPATCPCTRYDARGKLIPCANTVIQFSRYPTVRVSKTRLSGFGLKVTEFVPEGALIYEYRGEVLTMDQCTDRMSKYKPSDGFYFAALGNDLVLDASKMGSVARFANHSCDPNCYLQRWTVLGESRIVLVANEDLKPNTDVTYSYNFNEDEMENNPIRCQTCHCGSQYCTGTIGGVSFMRHDINDAFHHARKIMSGEIRQTLAQIQTFITTTETNLAPRSRLLAQQLKSLRKHIHLYEQWVEDARNLLDGNQLPKHFPVKQQQQQSSSDSTKVVVSTTKKVVSDSCSNNNANTRWDVSMSVSEVQTFLAQLPNGIKSCGEERLLRTRERDAIKLEHDLSQRLQDNSGHNDDNGNVQLEYPQLLILLRRMNSVLPIRCSAHVVAPVLTACLSLDRWATMTLGNALPALQSLRIWEGMAQSASPAPSSMHVQSWEDGNSWSRVLRHYGVVNSAGHYISCGNIDDKVMVCWPVAVRYYDHVVGHFELREKYLLAARTRERDQQRQQRVGGASKGGKSKQHAVVQKPEESVVCACQLPESAVVVSHYECATASSTSDDSDSMLATTMQRMSACAWTRTDQMIPCNSNTAGTSTTVGVWEQRMRPLTTLMECGQCREWYHPICCGRVLPLSQMNSDVQCGDLEFEMWRCPVCEFRDISRIVEFALPESMHWDRHVLSRCRDGGWIASELQSTVQRHHVDSDDHENNENGNDDGVRIPKAAREFMRSHVQPLSNLMQDWKSRASQFITEQFQLSDAPHDVQSNSSAFYQYLANSVLQCTISSSSDTAEHVKRWEDCYRIASGLYIEPSILGMLPSEEDDVYAQLVVLRVMLMVLAMRPFLTSACAHYRLPVRYPQYFPHLHVMFPALVTVSGSNSNGIDDETADEKINVSRLIVQQVASVAQTWLTALLASSAQPSSLLHAVVNSDTGRLLCALLQDVVHINNAVDSWDRLLRDVPANASTALQQAVELYQQQQQAGRVRSAAVASGDGRVEMQQWVYTMGDWLAWNEPYSQQYPESYPYVRMRCLWLLLKLDKASDGAGEEGVFCWCRGDEDGGTMVHCVACEEWFHAACVNYCEDVDSNSNKKKKQKKVHKVGQKRRGRRRGHHHSQQGKSKMMKLDADNDADDADESEEHIEAIETAVDQVPEEFVCPGCACVRGTAYQFAW